MLITKIIAKNFKTYRELDLDLTVNEEQPIILIGGENGGGIRTMRTLMEKSSLAPPTFESDHSANLFTTRLLLHHFLNETDLQWLDTLKDYELNDSQKKCLIFLREAGAIDNSTYRQLNACDVLRASNELRILRDKELITQKGKGKATYYIAGNNLNTYADGLNTYGDGLNTYGETVNTEPQALVDELPSVLREKIEQLGQRETDIDKIKELVYELCGKKSFSVKELSIILNRKENTVLRNYIIPLKEEGKLQYTIPDMPKHPDQAYRSI